MESKKFSNLSLNYKNFLLKCLDVFNNVELTENLDLLKLNQIHKSIENLLEINELQISDINHLIENYLKSNDQIDNLKKLVHIRNYKIISVLLRSSQWKEFILKLKLKCENANIKNVENAFIKLLEKYLGTWNTIDKFIVLDKKNNVKNVEIFDPDDYIYLFNILDKLK
jgi:hypothetical protein